MDYRTIALEKLAASYHVIAPNDTGYGIARKYKIPFSALSHANAQVNWNSLKPGTRLVLPQQAAPSTVPQATVQTKAPVNPVPAPQPAVTVKRTITPQVGVRAQGYGGPTLAAKSFQDDKDNRKPVALSPESRAQAVGNLAAHDLNYLVNNPEFQKRVGDGDINRGRMRISDSVKDLTAVPVVNEFTPSGPNFAAIAYTRPRDKSYIAAPAKQFNLKRDYRGAGDIGSWDRGMVTHELFHPFTYKLKGYFDKFKGIMADENIKPRDGKRFEDDKYYLKPEEQAAEFNAIRALKNLWPGRGAGPNGAYTEEQADQFLPSSNPYFQLLTPKAKARYLNEAKNKLMSTYRPQTTALA